MLLFIVLFFPGILYTYAAEYLMKRRLDTHYFVFLAMFNVLAINFISMLLRDIVTIFFFVENYQLAVESMENLVKQTIYSGFVGFPLCILEAIIGKYVSLRLEDTKKEAENEEKPQ